MRNSVSPGFAGEWSVTSRFAEGVTGEVAGRADGGS